MSANFSRLRTHYPKWMLYWIVLLGVLYWVSNGYFLLIVEILAIFFLFKDTVIDLGLKKGHWPKDLEHFPFSFIAIFIGIYYSDWFLVLIAIADSIIDFLEDIEVLGK